MNLVDFQIYHEIISGKIIIDPFKKENINPNSLDLRLGHIFRTELHKENPLEIEDEYILKPHEFILAHTLEKIQLPSYYMGLLYGKSSLGRQGLMIHMSGLIDSGFSSPPATITLQLFNASRKAIILEAQMKIAQIVFSHVAECQKSYDQRQSSKYNNQQDAQATK